MAGGGPVIRYLLAHTSKATLLLTLLACANMSPPVETSREATNLVKSQVELDLVASVHFPQGTRRIPPFIKPDWSDTPTPELIQRVFPAGNAEAGYAELACSLAEDRSLDNCRVARIDPSNEGFERAFLRLAQEYRLAGNTPRPEEIWRVSMIMRLRKENAGNEACGLFCVPTPRPPPPPPSKQD